LPAAEAVELPAELLGPAAFPDKAVPFVGADAEWVEFMAGGTTKTRPRNQLLAATIPAAHNMTKHNTATSEIFTSNFSLHKETTLPERLPRALSRSMLMLTNSNPPTKMPANSVGCAANRRPFCNTAMANKPSTVP